MQVRPISPLGSAPLTTTERDVDCAVDRMRREMALRGLRRRLRSPDLDARAALALSRLALELQTKPVPATPQPRRLSLFRASRPSQ